MNPLPSRAQMKEKWRDFPGDFELARSVHLLAFF